MNREGKLDLFGAAIVAALIAFALAFGAQRGRRTLAVVARTGDTTALAGTSAKFQLFPTQGRIEVSAKDGRSQAEIEMSLVVDGIERPLAMRRGDVHVKDKTLDDKNVEFGRGDTPIKEALQTIRDNKWNMQATIEFEIPGPAGPDGRPRPWTPEERMQEMAKCLEYCKGCLLG